MAVALSILRGYYPAVSGLQQYLNGFVDFQEDHALFQSDDTPAFTAFVHGSYVATDVPAAEGSKFRATSPMVHLHEARFFVCS